MRNHQILAVCAVLTAVGGPAAAEPGSVRRFGPGLLQGLPAAPFFTIDLEESDPPPLPAATVETHALIDVDNDDDGRRSRFLVRTDAAGRITHLLSVALAGERGPKEWAFGPQVRTCSARGSDRIDRRHACGVELEHARGSTSAMRLWTPDLDPDTGGALNIIYLRNYAIFGSHDVRDFSVMRIERTESGWGLFVRWGGQRRRVGGLFVHRASRGIGSLTACLDTRCPAEWTSRGRDYNGNLPVVFDPARFKRPNRWLVADQ